MSTARRRNSGLAQYNYFAIIFHKVKPLYHAYNALLRRATEMAGEAVRCLFPARAGWLENIWSRRRLRNPRRRTSHLY